MEALQSVQYVTVGNGRFAVIGADDWENLIEWLETLEDIQTAKEAFAQLKAAGGDREKAGWQQYGDLSQLLGEARDS